MKKIYSVLIATIGLMLVMVHNAHAYTPVLEDNLFNNALVHSYCSDISSASFSLSHLTLREVSDLDDSTTNNWSFGTVCISLPLSDITVLKMYSSGSPQVKFYNESKMEIFSKDFSANDATYYDVSIPGARYALVTAAHQVGTIFAARGDEVFGLDVPNIQYNTATLNFSTPSAADFNLYKIYKNGSLVYTSPAGQVKNSAITYPITGLTSNTPYTYKVTTVNTAGIESMGSSTTFTTLAASIGTRLTVPETGWRRYSYNSEYISYYANSGDSWFLSPSTGTFVSPYQKYGTGLKFNFTGTKFRLIANTWSTFSSSVTVKIDGQAVDTISFYGPHVQPPLLMYDINGLEDKEHYVEFVNNTSVYLPIFAIDVDESRELRHYNENIPNNLAVTNGNMQVDLSWNSILGADSYNIKRSTTQGGPYSTIATGLTDTVYIDTTVINGTTYYYVVTAVSVGGESDPSNEAIATPQDDAPSTVINLAAIAGDTLVNLSWETVNNATSYNIKRSNTLGGPYETVANVVYGTTSYVDGMLINMTTYYYVVSAVNGGGESQNSNEISATPQPKGRAIVSITLDNGIENEYDWSINDVNAFLDWFDKRDAGIGPSRYKVDKTYNIGPFTSRTDYLVFDKIMTFEIMEYEEEE